MKFILLAAVALSAQTTTSIKPDQLRQTPAQSTSPILLAFSPFGFTPVILGLGITVTQTPNGYLLDFAAPPAPKAKISRLQYILTRAFDGTYTLTGNTILYRNGLLMTPGADYTLTAGRVTPLTPWATDDIVVADEIRIE